MRTGILADIHGDVENLSKAIERLREESVDVFVVLGDVIYDKRNASETVALLKDCGAIGVWGNHELGLCVEPSDELRRLYPGPVMEFFSTLDAHLEHGDVLYSHSLPDQDARDPTSYYLGPRPDQPGALDRCFSQFRRRAILVGHFHRWLAATPAGRLAWNGERPLRLAPGERYLFVIHAVMDGWAAVLDDEHGVLTPIQL
jgi:predicted phosphodiesterase